jgi:hypothetical protein
VQTPKTKSSEKMFEKKWYKTWSLPGMLVAFLLAKPFLACAIRQSPGFWHRLLHPLWICAVCLSESAVELSPCGLHRKLGHGMKTRQVWNVN